MNDVIWHITMSLDGFIAGANDSMDWVFQHWSGDGAGVRDIGVSRSEIAEGMVIHLVPILLGDGIHLYEAPGGAPLALRRTVGAESGQVTDIRFEVAR